MSYGFAVGYVVKFQLDLFSVPEVFDYDKIRKLSHFD